MLVPKNITAAQTAITSMAIERKDSRVINALGDVLTIKSFLRIMIIPSPPMAVTTIHTISNVYTNEPEATNECTDASTRTPLRVRNVL